MDVSNTNEWDFFISHASEDKDEIANDLAEVLRQNYRVWYDDDEIRIGDSIRQAIDKGLARSQYGIIILSPNFFAKEWPQRELDALIEKERIFPVLHNISIEDVRAISPTIATLRTEKTSLGPRKLASMIIDATDLPSKTAIFNEKLRRLRQESLSFEQQLEWLNVSLNTVGAALKTIENAKPAFTIEMAVMVAKVLSDLLVDPALLIRLAAERSFPLMVYTRSKELDDLAYDTGFKFFYNPIYSKRPPGNLPFAQITLKQALEKDWVYSTGHERLSVEEFIWLMAQCMPHKYKVVDDNLKHVIGHIQAPFAHIVSMGEVTLELGRSFIASQSMNMQSSS